MHVCKTPTIIFMKKEKKIGLYYIQSLQVLKTKQSRHLIKSRLIDCNIHLTLRKKNRH